MKLAIGIFLCSVLLFGQENEETALSRVRAHLLLKDPVSALKEVGVWKEKLPESAAIKKSEIVCLARCGRAAEAYRCYLTLGSNEDLELLEEVAWGFLFEAEKSAQIPVLSSSLIGNFLTHDVRAVKALTHFMSSSHAGLRVLAIRLGANFGDAVLIEALKALLDSEKVWYVRLEIIRALGRLKVKSCKEKLETILNQSDFAEEKMACIQSLCALYDDVTEDQIDLLLTSKSCGLRLLGLQLLIHFDKQQWRAKCVDRLDDHALEVRSAALSALGMLGLGELNIGSALEQQLTEDLYPVNVHAAWLLLMQNQMEGYRHLFRLAQTSDDKTRRAAAAAIGSSGERGEILAEKLLKQSPDPYVRMNLAMHMLGSRLDKAPLTAEMMRFLQEEQDKLMFQFYPGSFFAILSPSEVRHSPHVAQYPLLVDQMVRLQLYSALAVVKTKGSERLIAQFLDQKGQGISDVIQAASVTLLQEGGRDALDQIKTLMHDQNLSDTLKLSAALVLAYTGEEEALDALKTLYVKFGRMEKLMIIEALSSVQGNQCLQFLTSLLDEHAHVLRIAAASAIIQSLRH